MDRNSPTDIWTWQTDQQMDKLTPIYPLPITMLCVGYNDFIFYKLQQLHGQGAYVGSERAVSCRAYLWNLSVHSHLQRHTGTTSSYWYCRVRDIVLIYIALAPAATVSGQLSCKQSSCWCFTAIADWGIHSILHTKNRKKCFKKVIYLAIFCKLLNSQWRVCVKIHKKCF